MNIEIQRGINMSYHIVKEKRKNGYAVVVRTTVRNEKGKSTSINCAILGMLKEYEEKYGKAYEEEIEKQGKEAYEKWKKKNEEKYVTTIYADEDETEENVYYSSQLYLRAIWNKLGLNKFINEIKKESKGRWKYNLEEVIFFLTSVQIINSKSKLGAYKDASNYLIKPKKLTIDSLYDCLDVLAENMDYINNYTYKKVKKYLEKDSKLFFYDVTTVNMSQSVEENEIIGIKKGKEGIYGPIIQIGCVCDQWGLLVGMYIFNGRRNEQETLKEQIEKILRKDESKNIVICTDAGLCSAKNKRYLENKFKGYIMTQPLTYKKITNEIKNWAVNEKFDAEDKELSKTKGEIIKEYEDIVKEKGTDSVEAKAIYNKVFYKSRWAKCETKIYKDKNKKEENKIKEIYVKKKGEEGLKDKKESELDVTKSNKEYIKVEYEQRLIVSFSLKYYYKQMNELNEAKEKANNAVNNKYDITGKSNKDYRRFIKSNPITQNGEVASEVANSFDEEKYNFEKSLCGLYCQVTNLEDDGADIYRYSRNRWQIEYAFRTAKTYQGFGTIYLHTIKHIIGHFELCFLAQQILKTLVYKLYNHIGYKDCIIGRRNKENENYNPDDFTLDKIIEELANLKTLKMVDDSKRTFFKSLSKKDIINSSLAEIFEFSLTKKGKSLTEIQEKLNEKIEL